MPHADSSMVPSSITSKAEFWQHVHAQLESLLEGERNWVTNLANAASLIFNSLLDFPTHFGKDESTAVNWCGFYIASHLFPAAHRETSEATVQDKKLLLGPFSGKPACQFIRIFPNPRGVCADAFIKGKTLTVPNVDLYPGHIACDGNTKSEIVCPLIVQNQNGVEEVIGVLDLDCLAVDGFDVDDEVGLVRISQLIAKACDW